MTIRFNLILALIGLVLITASLNAVVALELSPADIIVRDGRATLKSGSLERVIAFRDGNVSTTSLSVAGHETLAEPAREFSVAISREGNNRKPRALAAQEGGQAPFRVGVVDASRYEDTRPDAPKWIDRQAIDAKSWALAAGKPTAEVSRPSSGVKRLVVRAELKGAALSGVTVELNYEVYDGFPAVRKWAVVRNRGSQWLKLDRMLIEDLQLVPLVSRSLAAAMFGVQPSVVAFESPGSRYGLIAASEIPSALRFISDHGALGYTQNLFEWVLGPGEEFTSEPVFYYAFNGPVRETVSAPSTPLDRTIEGPYMQFLKKHIGVAAETAPMHGPQWMTWAYFYDRIDDKLVRQLADIVSQAGFSEMLLDDGWQMDRLGTAVDTDKFPDFTSTAEYLRSRNLSLGLWVSDYRSAGSRDLTEMPSAMTVPTIIRAHGFSMSFASPWREFYVKDLVGLTKRFGVNYLKQDFSNIIYGDLAEGHESRTLKESLLRQLRGLLAAQSMLRREAPQVVNEITHEIYWGTPGVPADLAALKCAARFHIPPNECIGSNIAREFRGRSIGAEEHAAALRQGCWLARQRFYSHRGMPLYPLEFYAAATASHLGSLTSAIQDRQIASWFMGMPVCYSGDARTLSPANIAHYRKRFDELKRLEKTYGIYKQFQFSGAPEPTDVDWHWWGKLNAKGHGAVVVLRGSAGAPSRAVNVPWVQRMGSYRVTGLFSGRSYGVLSGATLQDAGLRIELPVYGQEILELAPPARPTKAKE